MDPRHYILQGKELVPATLMEWGRWFADGEGRTVGRDELESGVTISTVCLGIDHGFNSTPLFFETMIFGGKLDQEQERYSTYEQAEQGHTQWVAKAKAADSD